MSYQFIIISYNLTPALIPDTWFLFICCPSQEQNGVHVTNYRSKFASSTINIEYLSLSAFPIDVAVPTGKALREDTSVRHICLLLPLF